jgi:hypothetical protein
MDLRTYLSGAAIFAVLLLLSLALFAWPTIVAIGAQLVPQLSAATVATYALLAGTVVAVLVRRAWLAVALVAAALVLLPIASLLAADGTTVDLSPMAALLREYLAVGIEALIAAAIGLALRWLHLSGNAKAAELAEQLRDFLHATAERALDRAVAEIGLPTSFVVKSDVLASAISYLQLNARDAVTKLKASPDDLERLLEAKLALRFPVAPPGPGS